MHAWRPREGCSGPACLPTRPRTFQAALGLAERSILPFVGGCPTRTSMCLIPMPLKRHSNQVILPLRASDSPAQGCMSRSDMIEAALPCFLIAASMVGDESLTQFVQNQDMDAVPGP